MIQYLLKVIIFMYATYLVEGTIRVYSVSDNETVYTFHERPLLIKSPDGLEGILVRSQPPDACTKVNPPQEPNGTYFINWILLATYESINQPCSIDMKIRNAEDAGYSGILIQTNPGNDSSYFPVSDWSGIAIYPCLVTFEEGNVLAANFTSENFILKFEDEKFENSWLGFFLASVLVIVAILFAIGLSYVIVQMLVLIIIWIRETIVNSIQQRRRDRRRRLPASQLKKLPVQLWTTDIPQDTCTICLDNFIPGENVRILPCSHVFHKMCIDPWLLTQRRKCPNCKGKIVFADERCDSDTSTEDERTPLLRRDNSAERDYPHLHPQVFSFNENDIVRHPPNELYTAIQRMLDESVTEPGPSPSHSSSSATPLCAKESSDPVRTHLRNKRLNKFTPKLSNKNPFQSNNTSLEQTTCQDLQQQQPVRTVSGPLNFDPTSSIVLPSEDEQNQVDNLPQSHMINQGDDYVTESDTTIIDSNQILQSQITSEHNDNSEPSDNQSSSEVNNQSSDSR